MQKSQSANPEPAQKSIRKLSQAPELPDHLDLVEKSGAWFSYGEERIGQGREKAKQYMKDNPEVALELENKLKELLLNNNSSFTEEKTIEEN